MEDKLRGLIFTPDFSTEWAEAALIAWGCHLPVPVLLSPSLNQFLQGNCLNKSMHTNPGLRICFLGAWQKTTTSTILEMWQGREKWFFPTERGSGELPSVFGRDPWVIQCEGRVPFHSHVWLKCLLENGNPVPVDFFVFSSRQINWEPEGNC